MLSPAVKSGNSNVREEEKDEDVIGIPPLKVLICTSNMGNAKPDEESMNALLPEDGLVAEVVQKTEYPITEKILSGLDSSSATWKRQTNVGNGGTWKRGPHTEKEEVFFDLSGDNADSAKAYFDIIILGMQEANFNTFKKSDKKKKKKNVHFGNLEDINEDNDDDDNSTSSASSTNSAPSSLLGPNDDPVKEPYALELRSVLERSFRVFDKEDEKEVEKEVNNETMKKKKDKRSKIIRAVSIKKIISKRHIQSGLNETVLMPITQTLYSADHTKASNDLGTEPAAVHTGLGGTVDTVVGALKNPTTSPTTILAALVKKRCPSYNFLVNFQRGEMRLQVLVRKGALEKEIKDVESNAVNTGIGSVLANKGGIVTSFTLRKTRFSFLSAHLEAHEGEAHFLGRCSDLADIFSKSRCGPGTMYDASITSHHMFVCGDLNFRVNLGGKWDAEKSYLHKSNVKKLTDDKDWDTLNEKDELRRALEQGHCLAGFNTLPCMFPPTFKVERKKGIVYQEKRSPSYTDRILWKSAHGLGGNVVPLAYEPVLSFSTSDHKPVRGAFSITPNAPPDRLLCGRRRCSTRDSIRTMRNSMFYRDVHFMMSNMKITGLRFKGQTPDTYILLVTDPPEVLKQEKQNNGVKILAGTAIRTMQTESEHESTKYRTWKGWPRSSTIENTNHPDWEGEAIKCAIQNLPEDDPDQVAKKISGAMLYITIMNDGITSADTVIGTVAVNLEKILSENFMQGTGVFEPILRDGKSKGMFECSINVVWMSRRGLC